MGLLQCSAVSSILVTSSLQQKLCQTIYSKTSHLGGPSELWYCSHAAGQAHSCPCLRHGHIEVQYSRTAALPLLLTLCVWFSTGRTPPLIPHNTCQDGDRQSQLWTACGNLPMVTSQFGNGASVPQTAVRSGLTPCLGGASRWPC